MKYSKIVSVDEYVILLEGNTARNPEILLQSFKLAVMENSECKALYLPNRFLYSQRQKEENLEDVHGKSVSKIKGKVVSHINLNLVVMHDLSLSLSAFSIVCSTSKRKLLFQINGIGQLTVQFTQKKKLQKYISCSYNLLFF